MIVRREVEARVETFKYVEVAWVEVELVAMSPPLNVCSAVQVFLLPRLMDATTFPVVGEIVRVPSELATEETPRARHDPLIEKHPAARLIPFENDDDPVPWTLMMPLVCMTPGCEVAWPTPSPPAIYVVEAIERKCAGVAVPRPILVFDVSSEMRGVAVVEDAIAKAFTKEFGIVEVELCP